MWIWTLSNTLKAELALYSILLPVRWAENNWGFPTVRIFPDSTVYVSARDGETWVWVLGKSRWPWRVSLIFRRCKLCSPPCCRVCACLCVVWVYFSVWSEPHKRVIQWWGCRVDCEGRWLLWTMPLCPAPVPPPLISGRPIGRRVPGPSQPSFPHGKYLTLTVAHVCHITHRSRRKIKTLYVWWMMELYNRSLMEEKICSSVVH